MAPVGCVLSNFGDHGDRVHLVASNFCDWMLLWKACPGLIAKTVFVTLY